jgi:hypothetical protein
MIHYQLRCRQSHEFDGWFRDSAAYAEQAAGGLVACPACGCTKIELALMAPSVPKRRRIAQLVEASEPKAAVPETVTAVAPAPSPIPDEMRAVLQKMRAEVEERCDYVGNDFAEEARRIHRGVTERRGIYGEASPAEAEALIDEGIECAQMPWVPRAEG